MPEENNANNTLDIHDYIQIKLERVKEFIQQLLD